jgi:hypothetical protein
MNLSGVKISLPTPGFASKVSALAVVVSAVTTAPRGF